MCLNKETVTQFSIILVFFRLPPKTLTRGDPFYHYIFIILEGVLTLSGSITAKFFMTSLPEVLCGKLNGQTGDVFGLHTTVYGYLMFFELVHHQD